jgi:hypothetical protein
MTENPYTAGDLSEEEASADVLPVRLTRPGTRS